MELKFYSSSASFVGKRRQPIRKPRLPSPLVLHEALPTYLCQCSTPCADSADLSSQSLEPTVIQVEIVAFIGEINSNFDDLMCSGGEA